MPLDASKSYPVASKAHRPLVVFALPRSRTWWLKQFLSNAPLSFGHDLAITADTIADLIEPLGTKLAGTVETGAMMGWRAIREQLPEARFCVIRRSLDEVAASMAVIGLPIPEDELRRRDHLLDVIQSLPGTTVIEHKRLSDPAYCAELYEWCHGIPCPPGWAETMVETNLQLDIRQRAILLHERYPQIETLKAEARAADERLRDARLPFVQIRAEPWIQVEAQLSRLGRIHFNEVEDNVEPRRQYELDCEQVRAIAALGLQLTYVGRIDGEIVGYCMWSINHDPESKGLLVANQGPWFALDRADVRRYRIGMKLWDRSVETLKQRGVQCIFPHHRLEGRGADLGAFFRYRGAKEIQRTYSMWIGD